MGKFNRARELLGKALAISEEIGGKDHILVARSLARVAGLDAKLGNFGDAEARNNRANKILGTQAKQFPLDDISVALNQALISEKRGKYKAALNNYRRADEISRKVLGASHPFRADVLTSISGTFEASRDRRGAIESARAARDIYARSFGESNQRTIESERLLNRLLGRQGMKVDRPEHSSDGWGAATSYYY